MIRVQGFAGGVACFVAPLYPAGLDDATPTVLGVRTVRAVVDQGLDVVLPLAEFREVVAAAGGSDEGRFVLPGEAHTAVWTAISPPRANWRSMGHVPVTVLRAALSEGIREVTTSAGSGDGDAHAGGLIVHRVRAAVWGRKLPGAAGVPAGCAWALDGLGFFGAETSVPVWRSGPWFRLAASFGDVLARFRPGE